MKLRFTLAFSAALLAITSPLFSQTTLYTWIVAGPDANFSNPANWMTGPTPSVPNSSSHNVAFLIASNAYTAESVILPAGSLSLGSLDFAITGTSAYLTNYSFTSAGTTTLSLQTGMTRSGNTGSTMVQFGSGINFSLGTAQTWSLTHLTVEGSITGSAKLTIDPITYTYNAPGVRTMNLSLMGANNFGGGFEARNASITVGHASALNGTFVKLSNADIEASTNFTLSTPLTLEGSVLLGSHGAGTLTIASTTTLQGDVQLTGGDVVFTGRIAQTTTGNRLTVTGSALISGDNSSGAYTGGTSVGDYARLRFGTANSVPATGLISGVNSSYVGAMFTTGLTTLISHLDPTAFLGTLGLDSPNVGSPQTFSETLVVSGLTGFRGIGSSTAAILAGTIDIGSGTEYRFGGGGGRLLVTSSLSNTAAKVVIDTSYGSGLTPLMLFLKGTNTYAAGTQIGSGAVIFDGPTALPSTGAITFTSSSGFGYAGYTEAAGLTPNAFLSRIAPTSVSIATVVGIDSANPSSPRTVSDPIDLTRGGTISSQYFLGTATRVTLTGPITPINNQLWLAGYNGGHLTIGASLPSQITHLFVGMEGSSNTGTVHLISPSSYSGGTTVYSGTLLLGHPKAIGSGPVTIGYMSTPVLAASTDLRLHNAISADYDLLVGQPGSLVNLTLSGLVDAEALEYQGNGWLRFTRMPYVGQLTINSASTGGVILEGLDEVFDGEYGYYGGRPFISLNSGSLLIQGPLVAVAGLEGDANTQIILGAGSTLRLYGSNGEGPAMSHDGTITGAGALQFPDSADIILNGHNTYSGGTTLSGDGKLQVGHNNALGTGPLRVTEESGSLTALFNGLILANGIEINPRAYPDDFAGLEILGANSLTLSGLISGTGGILKADSGLLRLSGSNTFAGGVKIEGGTVELTHNNAAGIGALLFEPHTSMVPALARFTTAAPVIYGLKGDGLPGAVELAAGSTLTINQNRHTVFNGTIGSVGANNAAIAKTGYGLLQLSGTNTYSGGTNVTGGGVVFGTTAALPTTGSGTLVAGTSGYIGYSGSAVATDLATFLGRFDKANTHGTIGFDGMGMTYLINVPLSLAGFASDARLGSASNAMFTSSAVITPQGTHYRFGGGGGTLYVASPLTDATAARALVVDSPATAPLTLRVSNIGNTFTGGVSVTHSAVIFAESALPATGAFTLGAGGYIGTESSAILETNSAMAAYLSRFPSSGGLIGFDRNSTAIGAYDILSDINLSSFTGTAILATASAGTFSGSDSSFIAGVTLHGAITPQGTAYRFAGYKSGALEVASVLSGARTVVIGDPSVIETFADANRAMLGEQTNFYSTVMLSGANTHTGNTILHGGRLILGNTAALGVSTNTLQVQSTTLPTGLFDRALYAQLASNIAGLQVPNPISLSTSLSLGGWKSFNLNGIISGTGGLNLDAFSSATTVTLAGNNTFTGGVYLSQGRLQFSHNNAAGLGTLAFGGDNSVTAHFASAAPIIKGLSSDNDYARVTLAAGTLLTIDQSGDTTFRGSFGSIEGGARIVKTGAGTLRLENDGDELAAYGGISAEIAQGAVVVTRQAYQPLGVGMVKLSGGTLALTDNVTFSNSLQTNSGRLAGSGWFASSPSIGAGMILSPGFGAQPIGRLGFDDLTLSSGGVYEWNLQVLSSGGEAADSIFVSQPTTLTIASNSSAPFIVRLISLQASGAPGFVSLVAGQGYSWLLFDAYGVSGFDPTKFTIDATQFSSNLGPGTFSLSLMPGSTSAFTHSVMLNFTPVPEPSTWVMMALGLGAVCFRFVRRRR